MVCARCGYCCEDCIFLEFNMETLLTTCLIHGNKFRVKICADVNIDDLFFLLEECAIGYDVPLCHIALFRCQTGEYVIKQLLSCEEGRIVRLRYITQVKKRIECARRKIADFDVLVQILNFTQNGYEGKLKFYEGLTE